MNSPRLAKIVRSAAAASRSVVSGIAALRPRMGGPNEEKMLEECRKKIAGTNIDPRSLLSTDYFNEFNSVVMILDVLPDAPELLEEVERWKFVGYVEHFQSSGLDFAPLAIEVFAFAPKDLLAPFEHKVNSIHIMIEEVTRTLRRLLDAGERDTFGEVARNSAAQLRAMMEEGNGIVHGSSTSSQAEIDKLF